MYKSTGLITLRSVKLNLNIVDSFSDVYILENLIPKAEAYVLSRVESSDEAFEYYKLDPLYKGIVLSVCDEFYSQRGLTTQFIRHETLIDLNRLLLSLRGGLKKWKRANAISI